MYVVKSANDGGNSLFLSSSDIVNQLSKTETGKKHLKTLTGNLYPFKAPASFDKNKV